MKERNSKAGGRDGGEDGLIHCGDSQCASGVGLVGFEPTASASRTQRSTKLSHSPNCSPLLSRLDAHPISRISVRVASSSALKILGAANGSLVATVRFWVRRGSQALAPLPQPDSSPILYNCAFL